MTFDPVNIKYAITVVIDSTVQTSTHLTFDAIHTHSAR